MHSASPRFLILGASGYLGHEVAAECARLGIPFVGTSRSVRSNPDEPWLAYEFPGSNAVAVFREVSPTHVIVAARLKITAAGPDDAASLTAHEESLRPLFRALATDDSSIRRTRVLYISSDAVFSGKQDAGPWSENDEPEPGTPYGRQQLCAERVFTEEVADGLIIRCSYLYAGSDGPMDKRWKELSDQLTAGRTVRGAANLIKSPVAVRTAAQWIMQAALSSLTCILHLPGDRMSVYEFFVKGLERLELIEKRSLLQSIVIGSHVDTSLRSMRLAEITERVS